MWVSPGQRIGKHPSFDIHSRRLFTVIGEALVSSIFGRSCFFIFYYWTSTASPASFLIINLGKVSRARLWLMADVASLTQSTSSFLFWPIRVCAYRKESKRGRAREGGRPAITLSSNRDSGRPDKGCGGGGGRHSQSPLGRLLELAISFVNDVEL